MFCKISLRSENIISLLTTFFLISLMVSCAQAPVKKEVSSITEEKPAQIESIKVISDPSNETTMIQITSSKVVSYTTFKLVQPLRLIVDLNALPGQGLTGPGVINDRLIKDIHFEKVKNRPMSTRLIANLNQDIEYNVRGKDKTVKFLLSPKKISEIEKRQPLPMPSNEAIAAKKPRPYFSPSKTKLNEILGVDFYMLSKGESRVTVTTSKKSEYDLTRKNSLTLVLEIMGATIPSELTRYLNSSLFKGAVSRITPIVRVAQKQVYLEIELKEMVPYHVMQTDKEIRFDFSKTSVNPAAKKIPQTRLGKALVKEEEFATETKPAISPVNITPTKPPKKKYKGEIITINFYNSDIKTVLKFIATFTDKNIIWNPDKVKGTVSMRLEKVPWDQALHEVLIQNDLGIITEGNIIRVMTQKKIKELEKEKEERRKAEREKIEEAIAVKKATEAVEPLITETIAINFKDANEIKDLVKLGKRGTVNVFESENSLIITDTESSLKKAKEQVKKIDTATKQIMIEARIVDALDEFSRDLGVQWNSIDRQWKKRIGMGWNSTDPTTFSRYKDQSFGGSFSSNVPPSGWASNIGLRFATITNKGLGTLVLDASLALGETDGTAKIISAPKVIASNGEEAIISRGDIIYKNIVTADKIEVKELPATLKLTVTPTVSYNNYVTLDVEIKDDRVYKDQSGKTEKRIKTKLMVKSGDTVVIGGIYKEEKAGNESGIPGLSKIPFLGWLFKAENKTRSKSELLVFLTPTVLTHLRETRK